MNSNQKNKNIDAKERNEDGTNLENRKCIP